MPLLVDMTDIGTLSDLLTNTASLSLSGPSVTPDPALNLGVVMDINVLVAACTAVSNMQQVSHSSSTPESHPPRSCPYT